VSNGIAAVGQPQRCRFIQKHKGVTDFGALHRHIDCFRHDPKPFSEASAQTSRLSLNTCDFVYKKWGNRFFRLIGGRKYSGFKIGRNQTARAGDNSVRAPTFANLNVSAGEVVAIFDFTPVAMPFDASNNATRGRFQ
jgi:hypothetical protein